MIYLQWVPCNIVKHDSAQCATLCVSGLTSATDASVHCMCCYYSSTVTCAADDNSANPVILRCIRYILHPGGLNPLGADESLMEFQAIVNLPACDARSCYTAMLSTTMHAGMVLPLCCTMLHEHDMRLVFELSVGSLVLCMLRVLQDIVCCCIAGGAPCTCLLPCSECY